SPASKHPPCPTSIAPRRSPWSAWDGTKTPHGHSFARAPPTTTTNPSPQRQSCSLLEVSLKPAPPSLHRLRSVTVKAICFPSTPPVVIRICVDQYQQNFP